MRVKGVVHVRPYVGACLPLIDSHMLKNIQRPTDESLVFLFFPTGLVPVATRDGVVLAPDPEGNLDPSPEKVNRVLAIADLVHAPVNPAHTQLTGNPSPAQRAVRR